MRFSATGYLVIIAVFCFGVIGFLDDWIKIRHQRSLGLNKRAKLAAQVAVAVLFAELSVHWAHTSTALSFTRLQTPGLALGQVGWVVFAVVVMVGTSNAVNITDGLDGLAAGSATFCFVVLAIIGYWIFRHFSIYHLLPASAIDLALASVAMGGGCLGFLWWNAAPARIIMGDTGSLAIGSGLAALCLLLNLDLLLPIVGGLFVLETLSVVIQVVSYRLFGQRVFRMAPLQHHFELLGWPETTVIVRFWVMAGLFGALGLGIFYGVFLTSQGHVSPHPTPRRRAGSPPGAGAWASMERWVGTPQTAAGWRPPSKSATGGLAGAVHQLPTSTTLVALVAALCLVGVVMVGSASEVVSIDTYGSPWAILLRECLWLAVGLIVFATACRVDYRRWRRWSGLLMVVTMVLLLAVLVPGVGTNSGGSTRWLGFGPLIVQPSELMKLALALFGADLVARRIDRGATTGPGGRARCCCSPPRRPAWWWSSRTWAPPWCSAASPWPSSSPPGCPWARSPRCSAALGALGPGRGHGRALPAGPAAVVLGSRGPRLGFGLPGGAVPDRLGLRPLLRGRPGQRPGEVGVPAQCPHRLHLLGHRRGAGPDRGALAVLALLLAFAWFGLRAAARAPDRLGGLLGRGPGGVDRRRDHHQRRRRSRHPAGHRDPTALHLLRRVLLGHHHGGRRHPGEHRPSRAAGRPPRPRAAPGAGPGAAGRGGEPSRRRRRGGRGRHRGARAARPGGGPGPGRRGATARPAIEMVGSRRGQEADLLAGAGFPLTLLPGRGIARRLDPRSVVANAGALAGLAWATAVRAFVALGRWRPGVVVSVGGYASFPAGAAAVVLRVPLVLVNVDAVPGLVHRVLGRFAAASAVAFPGTLLRRAVVTGAPVRDEVGLVDRSPEGGGQGPGRPGSARPTAARWPSSAARSAPGDQPGRGRAGGALGRAGRREPLPRHRPAGLGGDRRRSGRRGPWRPARACYRLVPFEPRMDLLYQAADVVVCRAGAMTVAELLVAGVPAILIPLPGAPGDHQTANARALVDGGAAVLVADRDCEAERLAALLDELLADPARLSAMAAGARAARPARRRRGWPRWWRPMPADPAGVPGPRPALRPSISRCPGGSTWWASGGPG